MGSHEKETAGFQLFDNFPDNDSLQIFLEVRKYQVTAEDQIESAPGMLKTDVLLYKLDIDLETALYLVTTIIL